MSENTARKICIHSLIRKMTAVALTAVFLFGAPGTSEASRVLPSVSVVRADDTTSTSSYTSPVYDYYIKVQSKDGTGAVLRKQSTTNSSSVLTENIPDGTVLHITGQADDGNGGIWGFTNYSDVAEGYILLQQAVTVDKDSLIAKEDPNAVANASVRAREQQLEQYFQTVDENGNPVEGGVLGVGDNTASSASSSSSAESVSSGSASESVKTLSESVSSGSAVESVKANSGSESVRSSSGSLDAGVIAVGPLKLPKLVLFGGIGAVAAIAVVLVLLLKKKKKGGAGGDEAAEEGASAEGADNAKAGGRDKAKKGRKMSRSKPVKQAAADKMGKKK